MKSDLKLIEKSETPLLRPDFDCGPSLFKVLSSQTPEKSFGLKSHLHGGSS